MLTPGIHQAYDGVGAIASHPAVTTEARGAGGAFGQGQAGLFSTSAAAFTKDSRLHSEIFGAASLLVRCPDLPAMSAIVEGLEGQLTGAVHIDEADYDDARSVLPVLERRVGRILVNGFGTGVEVGHAMVHGGPYPSTADGRSTSVGSLAIFRFPRPVCYQDVPDALLPAALKRANPLSLLRRVDSKLEGPGEAQLA